MPGIDLVELRKQQRRYYALLNGAQRGLRAPPPLYPNRRKPSFAALGRKLSINKQLKYQKRGGDTITLSRNDKGTGWKVNVSQSVYGNVSFGHGNLKLENKKPAVHIPTESSGRPAFRCGQWTASTLPRDLESVLSFRERMRGGGSRETSGTSSHQNARSRRSFVGESCCRISSGKYVYSLSRPGSSYKTTISEVITSECTVSRKTPTCFPSIEDIVQERVESLPEPDYYGTTRLPMLRAPRAFQPKISKNYPFSVELTKPFAFSYYQRLNWR